MWGSSAAINHSLCCFGGIQKGNWSTRVLNHWPKSHTDSVAFWLISFNSVIHCDSILGFLNSTTIACLICANVLVYLVGAVLWYFIHHIRARSLNVVVNYTILKPSSCTSLAIHMASHINKCFSRSSDPFPWNTGILNSSPILFFGILLLGVFNWTVTTTIFFPLIWPTTLPLWQLNALLPLLIWLSLLFNYDKTLVLTSYLGDSHGVVGSTRFSAWEMLCGHSSPLGWYSSSSSIRPSSI